MVSAPIIIAEGRRIRRLLGGALVVPILYLEVREDCLALETGLCGRSGRVDIKESSLEIMALDIAVVGGNNNDVKVC